MPDSPRFSAEDPAEQRRRAAQGTSGQAEITDFDDGAGGGEDYFEDKPKRGCLGTLLIGCLWGMLVLLILGAILAFVVYRNWRKWAADFGSEAIKQSINQTELPAQEKDEIGVQVDRLAQAFRDEKLSADQMKKIFELLVDSPLATAMIVAIAETKYFDKSGLSDEEKTEGLRDLRRFARGMFDDKIPEDKRDAVMQHVADRDAGGNWKLREHVSDDELRALITEAKAAADAANIDAEPEVIDPSDEFKRIVDEALGEQGAAEEDGSVPDAAEAPAEPAVK